MILIPKCTSESPEKLRKENTNACLPRSDFNLSGWDQPEVTLTCKRAENHWLESSPNRFKLYEKGVTIIGLNKFTLGGKMPQIPILTRYNMVLYGSQISSPRI